MTKKESGVAQFLSRLGILGELLHFLWERKNWWLFPVVLVLIVFAVLLIAAQGSVLGPFIYTLF